MVGLQHRPAHENTRAGVDLVGLLEDALTRLWYLMTYVKTGLVVG